MRRYGPILLRVALLLVIAGVAGAQSEFEVTMRVVEDVRGLDAVVIAIGSDAVETRVDGGRPAAAARPAPTAAQ